MKRKIIYISFFFCVSLLIINTNTNAQTFIRGIIQDKQGNRISSASVSLIDSFSRIGLAFTESFLDGRFELPFTEKNPLKKISLKIVAWGYKTQSIAIDSFDKMYTITMDTSENILPNVTVKNNSELFKRGDTLIFTTNQFAEKNDRVIGDVLKRIPGIMIDENGGIRFNNKSINYFYIDGDNLLDGNYNIAANNIPATVVDKIQIIENNQHIKLLNGIIASESPAINITIKEDAKTNYINTASLAIGDPSLYQVELSNMAFKSKYKAINNIKANNTGISLADEIRSHTPQSNSFSLSENQFLHVGIDYTPAIQKKRIIFNTSFLTNSNLLFKVKKDLNLRLNAVWVSEYEKQSYNFNSNYYLPNDTIAYDERSSLINRNRILQTQVTADINSKSRYLRNTLSFWSHVQNQASSLISSGENINQSLIHNLSAVSNNFQSIVPLKKDIILSFFSNTYLSKIPENLVVLPGLHKNLLNSGNSYLGNTQHTNNHSFQTHQYISINNLKKLTSIQYVSGFQFQQNKLASHLFITELNNSEKKLADSFTNQFSWKKIEVYFKGVYSFEDKRSRLLLTIPIRFISINFDDPRFFRKDGITRYLVTPDFSWRYKLQKEHTFSFQASHDTKFSDFRELFGGIIMNNYRSFVSNNIPTQLVKTFSFNTTIEFKRTTKLLNARIGYYSSIQKANFAYSYFLNTSIIQKKIVEIQNDIRFNTASIYLTKYFFPIRTSFSVNFNHSFSNFNQFQNGVLFPVQQLSNNLFIGLGKKINTWASLKYEMFYNWNRTNLKLTGTEESQKNINNRHSISIDIYPLEKLSCQFTHASYYNHQRFLSPSSFRISDILFRYSVSKKISAIELLAQNLFNTQYFVSSATSGNQFSQTNYDIRTRMLLVKVLFNLQHK